MKKSMIENIERLKGFDLNLLTIFEAIYIHSSVTKAAVILGISASAVSQSLAKLRAYFSDPLFVREGNGLTVTTVAENLHENLSGAFGQLLNSVDHLSGDAIKKKFVIHSTAYTAVRVLPAIMAAIERHNFAWEVEHISSISTFENEDDFLIYRKADIIFGTKPHYSSSMSSTKYFHEPVVPVCRKNHPRLDHTIHKGNMVDEPSTGLLASTEVIQKIQTKINDQFDARKVIFLSHSIMINTAISESTDAISFIPAWFAKKFGDSFNIKVLKADFDIPDSQCYMTYNKSSLKNEGFPELLELINGCKKDIE